MTGAAGILGSLKILVDADTMSAQRKLKAFGGQAQVVGAAIGAGIGLAGVAMLKIGDEYKAATDSIRIGTGATGDQLAGLEQSFKNVSGRVPDSLAIVGQALADVKTRTGLTGAGLEQLTESFVDMSRLLKVDTSSAIASITRAYGDWSIATEDQLATNDLLLRASQATGMGVDALAQQLVQFGAPLRNLGYEFEDGVAMLSKWEKEGVNTTLALGGLKQALGKMALQGIEAKSGLADLFDSIVNAKTATEAMAIGATAFGKRAGPDMVAAIREGRFEFADFADELKAGTETVQKLSDDTRDFGDDIKEAMNRIKTAIGPVTDGFAGIAEGMGNAIFLLPALTGAVGKGLGKLWQKAGASNAIKGAATAAGVAAGAIYSRALAAGGAIMDALRLAWARVAASSAGGAAITAAGTAAGALYSAGAFVATAFTGALSSLWALARGPAILAAAGSAGTAAGGAFGLAFKLAAVAGIALIASEVKPHTDNLGKDINQMVFGDPSKMGEGMLHGTIFDSIGDTVHAGWDAAVLNDPLRSEEGKAAYRSARNYQQALERGLDSSMIASIIGGNAKGAEGAAAQAGVGLATAMASGVQRFLGATQTVMSDLGIDESIKDEMDDAAKAVRVGFGNIKDALKNPPNLISGADRLVNMKGRLQKAMGELNKAVAAKDPVNERYWSAAVAKQKRRIASMETRTRAGTSAMASDFKKAGGKINNELAGVERSAKKHAKGASTGMISTLSSMVARIRAFDLSGAGSHLVMTLVSGMRSAFAAAQATATELAANLARLFTGKSPPVEGPLMHIDKDGARLVDTLAGGVEGNAKRLHRAGVRVAGAFDPRFGQAGALSMGGGGSRAAAVHFHIGTLIANEQGIDELERRMTKRRGRTTRGRRLPSERRP